MSSVTPKLISAGFTYTPLHWRDFSMLIIFENSQHFHRIWTSNVQSLSDNWKFGKPEPLCDKGWRSSWLLHHLFKIITSQCNDQSYTYCATTIYLRKCTCCSRSWVLDRSEVSWLHSTSSWASRASWALSPGQSASLRWSSWEASLDTDALCTDTASISMEKSWRTRVEPVSEIWMDGWMDGQIQFKSGIHVWN